MLALDRQHARLPANARAHSRTRPPVLTNTASITLAVGASALYAWTLLERHAQFQTFTYDLGLLAQVSWNSLHGQFFATTILAFNYLADHCSPVLVLLSPLFLLWPDVRVLLLVQALAVGAAGVGIYAAARARGAGPPVALAVQTAFFLAPVTGWVALDEFHPITLALPAMTFATALLWRGRPGLAAITAALALLTSEDATIWIAAFGGLVFLAGGRRGRLFGPLLTISAVAWLAAYLFVVVPLVRPASLAVSDPHPDIGVFIYCGSTWQAIADCLVTHPGATLHQLLRPGGQASLLALLAPTGELGLLGPSFLVAIPRWLVLLMSTGPGHYDSHYAAVLAPTAYLAVAEAVTWLPSRLPLSPRVLAGFVLACSLLAYRLAGPLPGGLAYHPPSTAALARDATLDRAVALVPADPTLNVVATSSLLPHLALRSQIYLPWADPPDPAYRVLDLTDAYPVSAADLQRLVARWRADANYQTLLDQDNVLVQRRVSTLPQIRLQAPFDGIIELDGATLLPAGQQLDAHLYWRSLRQSSQDYHFFVHLVNASGKLYSQADGELLHGLLPLSQWPPGYDIQDDVRLPAPPVEQWPRYHLEIGWYDWRTGQRLTLPDGNDHVVVRLQG